MYVQLGAEEFTAKNIGQLVGAAAGIASLFGGGAKKKKRPPPPPPTQFFAPPAPVSIVPLPGAGIPMWAWVAGGAAVAGGLGLLLLRR